MVATGSEELHRTYNFGIDPWLEHAELSDREIGDKQCAVLKIRCANGGFIEAGKTQIGVAQIGPMKTRLAEVRALQLGPLKNLHLAVGRERDRRLLIGTPGNFVFGVVE